MTNDILYMKIDQNIEVFNKDVTLGDIAKLECANKSLVNKLRVTKVITIKNDIRGRHVFSVMDIIAVIQQSYPSLEICNLGQADFILTYEKEKHLHVFWSWVKTLFICFVTFFGAAFAIMTFNNDVDVPMLFSQLYLQATGEISNGFTIIEISYSIGIGLGILIFFNHFCGKKITSDPTPIQVEMRIYEDDVNSTLIESADRKEKNQNVS